MRLEDRKITEKTAVHWRSAKAAQEKRKERPSMLRYIPAAAIALIVLLFVFLFAAGYLGGVKPVMAEDTEVNMKKDDLGWLAGWTPAELASEYRLELFSGTGQSVFTGQSESAGCYLPATLSAEETYVLNIVPVRGYKIFGKTVHRLAGEPMVISLRLKEEGRYETLWRVDPGNRTLTVSVQGGKEDVYHLYLMRADNYLEEISRMQYSHPGNDGRGHGELVLSFGDDKDFPLPEEGGSVSFLLRAERLEEHLRIWEDLNEVITVRRDDLLTGDLYLEQEPLGDNRFRLSWNEAACKGYIIQKLDNETLNWETIAEIESGGPRSFDTDRLASGRYHSFRVVTINYGNALATQSEVRVHTDISPVQATVWNTQEMPLYSAMDKKTTLATLAPCTALCVLEEQGKFFKVFSAWGEGYVESDRCMINLPEYLGDLCAYDITNSYYNIYMVHDYEIRGLSGTVCIGYENVLLADGSFLVPLLYPVAKRLATAARNTLTDGMRLKIYDSFRPYVTTRAIYDVTAAQLDNLAPAQTMRRVSLEEFLISGEKVYLADTMVEALAAQTVPEEGEGEGTEGEEPVPQPYTITDPDGTIHYYHPDGTEYIPEEVSDQTYRQLMCGSGFSLNAFLAQSGSRHNFGVAVDLTLERLDTGEEMSAQTHMHDLSYHSVTSANNDIANILKDYMFSAGFAGLSSEWWHFQDDDVYAKLKPALIQDGVSIEGWKADDHGKRYRRADGSYVREASVFIGDRECHFNEEGYLSED
ncbi:MAG: hypothetical protein IK115_14545 [Lachnospiraceae bacterium]|nr:hypothetical protein [Lachnospiraceae bacterium]